MRIAVFIVWTLLVLGGGVLALLDASGYSYWIAGCCGGALLLMMVFFRMTVLPGRVTKRGFELLESQDFNNRLVSVGEPDADRMVRLFNSMIDRLRNERLMNLERQNFLQLLLNASPLGVMMLDFDGRVSMANGAFLSLCGLGTYEDIEGKTLEELPSAVGEWLRGIPLGESLVFRPGDSRLFRGSHQSFVQSGFNRRFYLLENLTEEMMQAERSAYEKVIRVMSHEVNNTMGGVRSVFGMLMDELSDDEIKDVIESCDRRCEDVCAFINDYADVVRLPAPTMRRIDIGEMLTDLLPFLRSLTPEDIELSLDLKGELVLSADRTQLEQVVVNIVKNAYESFALGKGKDDEKESLREEIGMRESDKKWIKMTAERKGKKVVIEISNNGSPITDEVASRLFSPFFTTKPSGKGLGLTLTGEILSNHNALWSLRTLPTGVTRFAISL